VPPGRRDTFDLPPSMKAALCPLDCCGFSGVRAACPHLETAPAVLNDGSALTNATIVAPARPPSSIRIGPQPSEAKTLGTGKHLARENTWHGMSSPG